MNIKYKDIYPFLSEYAKKSEVNGLQDQDDDLDAIAALTGTGLLARTGTNTWALRTATGTSNQVIVANGDGVSGNPTFSTPQDLHTAALFQVGQLGVGAAPVSTRAAKFLGTATIQGIQIISTAAGENVLDCMVSGEANARLQLRSAGAIHFGAGGGAGLSSRLVHIATNVIQIDSGSSTGARFRWGFTSTAAVIGDLGMDVATGRPSCFVGGAAVALAHTGDLPLQSGNATNTRSAAAGSGTATIAHGLSRTPKVVMISSVDDGSTGVYSDGWSSGTTMHTCHWHHTVDDVTDQTKSLHVETSTAAGYTATVTAIDATNITLTYTVVGAGRAITAKLAFFG